MCSSISSVLPINVIEDNSYVTSFNYLLEKKAYVDVTFVLEGEEGDTTTEFFAHKLILSMRSSYFEDKLYDVESEEESHIIRLKKVNPQALNNMIRYCYGNIPQLETAEEIYALYKVAEQFKVISLMNLCHTQLINIKIEPKNVFTMLKFSEVTHNMSLKDKCNKVLVLSTREVMTAYELCDITPSMVHTVLDLATLSLDSEYELLKWVFDWAEVKAKERDLGCENAREYLQKLLQDMNFLALTYEEFAKLCNNYPDFFSLDEIASVYLNISKSGSCKMPDWYDSELKFRTYTGSRKLEQGELTESLISHKEQNCTECNKTIKTCEPIKLSDFDVEQFRPCLESNEKLNHITEMIHKNDLNLNQCKEFALEVVKSLNLFHDVTISMLKDLQSTQKQTLQEIQIFQEMQDLDEVDQFYPAS